MESYDNHSDESLHVPTTGPAHIPQYPHTPPKPKKRYFWKIVFGIILTFSIIMNMLLFLAVVGMSMSLAVGQGSGFVEKVIADGPMTSKIAIINLQGVINEELSEEFRQQLEAARKDVNVKAVIIRTVTPGGGVSASDRIHYEITKFRQQTGKPVIAFMQTIATSGGYYTSVACDEIVSEPTTITGSIGVIMSHLVVKGLLEEKLGINPVVIKSGPKKDWPSSFTETTDEQKVYLMEKLIGPAYNRFVYLVSEGRKSVLSEEEVRILADGSIYGAREAFEKKLVDKIGYIDTAIETAKKQARLVDAMVIEYAKPFTMASLLSGQNQSILNIDRNTIQQWAVPELLYMWDGRN